MKPTWLHALFELKRRPASSTTELAKRMAVSQQTASRWLSQLRKKGLVAKNGQYAPTLAGLSYFTGLSNHVNQIIGSVFQGVGEGKYYLSKKGYNRQFEALLGFVPYPGTLNLRLDDGGSLNACAQMRGKTGRKVAGFAEARRTYGGARCFPCLVNAKIAGAIIVPDRTHYPSDVVEVLSPVFLRGHLLLKDGDNVVLQID